MKRIQSIIHATLALLAFACNAFPPGAHAVSPAPDGGYPGGNTAEGQAALLSLTTGGYNTAVGFLALRSNATNSFNTALGAGTLAANRANENTAVGAGALLSNSTGTDNTANGVFALANNMSGSDNTANGVDALLDNTAGFDNTANGVGALESNTMGFENTAVGVAALEGTTDGSANTAVGVNALGNNTGGSESTAIGDGALFHATGNQNIALGSNAGIQVMSGGNNIEIGNIGADESNTIRIGSVSHTSTYIGGIAGQTVGPGGTTCYVDNDGKLGVFLSARRYKKNIQGMGDASAALYSLKPVTFYYKPEFDKSQTPQFGLIAEEVAEVSPDLVTHNAKGELSTVRYDAVNAMLLNEFLKEHRKVEKLEGTVADLAAELRQMKAQVQTNVPALRLAAEP